MERSVVKVSVFLTLGIFISSKFSLKTIYCFILIISSLIMLLFFKKAILKKILICFIYFNIGIILLNIKNKEDIFFDYNKKNVKINFDVVDIGKRKDDIIPYKIKINNIDNKKIKIFSILNISNNFNLEIGENITLLGNINIPKDKSNPNLFDYKNYLKSKGIFFTVYSEGLGFSKNKNTDFFLHNKKLIFNNVNRLSDVFLNKINSDFVKSLILHTDSVPDEEKTEIKNLNLSHLLAISGLHVGIIFYVITIIGINIKIHRFISEGIALFILLLYSALIGFPISMVRAIIMIFFYCVAFWFKIPIDSINVLSYAYLFIIFNNPYQIYDPGFILSFAATFGIIYAYKKYLTDLDLKNSKIKNSLIMILCVQVFTLPIQINLSNEFNFIGIVANLLLVPYFSWLLISIFLFLIIGQFSYILSLIIGKGINSVLNLFFIIVKYLNEIEIFKISYRNLTIYELILIYMLLFAVINYKKFKIFLSERLFKFLLNFQFALILHFLIASLFFYNIKINFLDIGQGDCCLIRSNGKNILFDTGGKVSFKNKDYKDYTLVPYLKKLGIKRINYVFLSHMDSDHVKNLENLCQNINVENVFVRKGGTDEYVKRYGRTNIDKFIEIDSDTVIKIGELKIKNYYNPHLMSENNKSLINEVSVYNTKILFSGDIEETAEHDMLKKLSYVDILKVPHHGSETSSSMNFLEVIKPKDAIISVGVNSYNHPSKSVINRYKKISTNIYRTDLNGNIEVTINKSGYQIDVFLDKNADILKVIEKNIITYGFFTILSVIIFNSVIYFKLIYCEEVNFEIFRCS